MNRRTSIALSLTILLCVGAVIAFALATDAIRDATTVVATTAGAIFAGVAAYVAVTSAKKSKSAAQTATQALLASRRNQMLIALWPDYGETGNDWTWVFEHLNADRDSPHILDFEMIWTVGGVERRISRQKVPFLEIFKAPTGVSGAVADIDLPRHLPHARATWYDAERTAKWECEITVAGKLAPGMGHEQPATRRDWDDRAWGTGPSAQVEVSPPRPQLRTAT